MKHHHLRYAICIMAAFVMICSGFMINADAQSAQPPVYAKYTPEKTIQPQADFTADPTSGIAPLHVRFTDTSLYDPESWLWDLDGDGRIDDQVKNPEYTYLDPGTYTVTLIVSNRAGEDEETRKGFISVREGAREPVADFTADVVSGTVPLTVRFTDKSLNGPYSREWDLDGDGWPDSREENPTYTYQQPGFFTVRLMVWNEAGEDEVIKPGFITALPGKEVYGPNMPGEPGGEEPPANRQTPSDYQPPSLPRDTRPVEPEKNTVETPNQSLLLLLLAAVLLVLGGGLLYHRYRSSRNSADGNADLHLELSGGIDFGGALPPLEDDAEDILSPEKDRERGGG